MKRKTVKKEYHQLCVKIDKGLYERANVARCATWVELIETLMEAIAAKPARK